MEWKNDSNKNEMAVIIIPGTNNFKLSPLLFAIINPKTGPKECSLPLINQKTDVEIPPLVVLVLILTKEFVTGKVYEDQAEQNILLTNK